MTTVPPTVLHQLRLICLDLPEAVEQQAWVGIRWVVVKKNFAHVVVIEGMRFVPETLAVHRGDRVVWRNQDLVPHTATAAGNFDSKAIAPGGSWSTVAAKTGTLGYVCSYHPTMKGVLTVQ